MVGDGGLAIDAFGDNEKILDRNPSDISTYYFRDLKTSRSLFCRQELLGFDNRVDNISRQRLFRLMISKESETDETIL